jgi:hypothetical protein
MTRTITRSEFVNGAGEGVYVSTVHYASAAEREAGDAACQRVVVAAAFTPFGHAGEPQDPPEPWPSDKTATEYAPPNCDGFGHEPTQSGQALAHAQHEAAIDGDECTAGACLLTRGSD